jgi:DNA invertase Pin-like site-specific DNA recombinase
VPFYTATHGVDVDTFTLHIHAAVGEQERRLVGQRTKDALAALQVNGGEWHKSTVSRLMKAAQAA